MAARTSPSRSSLDAHFSKSQSPPLSFSSSSSSSSSYGGSSSSSWSKPVNLASPPCSRSLDGRAAGQSLGRPVHPSSSTTSPAATPRGVPPHVGGPPTRGPSLGPQDILRTLENFRYVADVDRGTLEVRPMAPADDVGAAAKLLAASFADAMRIPPRKVRSLEFWVQQYLEKKGAQRPHAATLLGFYREGEGAHAGPPQLVCTAEVWFDEMGDDDGPMEPAPPRGAPYILNMTVKKDFRRRRIGWHLLKACETLVSKMCSSSEVYLHCRLRDEGPLNMYKKAGYMIVKTDSFWVWTRLKHRKHLLCKKLHGRCVEIE